MPRLAKTIEKGLYQPILGNWKPKPECHPLLREAYHRARLREHFERGWKDSDFSATKIRGTTPKILELGKRFDKVRREMRAISKKSGAGLFWSIFGRSPHRPEETETVLTPFGMIFILSRRDYERVLPKSLSNNHYLINEYEQDKILLEAYRERISLVSRFHMDESLQGVKTDVQSLSRQAYERMYLALHEFGQFRKMFSDEILHSSVLHIARLWDGSHEPMGYTSEILRQAGAVMKWWKEAFLGAIVKDEIIAGLASQANPRTLMIKLFFLTIDKFDSEFHSQLESFVSSHAQEIFGDSRRYRGCIRRFVKKCDKMNISSYQEELKNRGISAAYKLLDAGIPLRVVLELAESIELRNWAESMPAFIS